ncbi:MAG: hypothetical protein KAR31_13790 [Candidatus Omnitrophica bacterium]|nr:hypothetical protein [Candidatus Omnitrophota bacterium]
MNKSLYKDELVKQAVLEDRDWVKEAASSSSGYVCLELKTPDTRDVLNWVNYLIYLHKG